MSQNVESVCLKCGAKFSEGAYGLTQCPSCHTFVLIDFEGHVQKAPPSSSDSGELEAPDFTAPPEPQVDSKDIVSEEARQAEIVSEENASTEQATVKQTAETSNDLKTFDEIPVSSNEEVVQQTHVDEKVNEGQDLASASTPHELQDVVDYANSEIMDSGGFYYNIMISGIDSKDLRESVLDVLNDSRLGWKKEDMAGLIENGSLQIQKINAAKTYVLMSSLKFLPLTVRWDQVSFTKS